MKTKIYSIKAEFIFAFILFFMIACTKKEDKDKIESSWLGAVIKDYYTGDLKEILERATWLGNDQAHYNRLFDEYDIDVLKELIELIMVELDRQHKMKHYIETIQKRK